ncbi:30S ribosomal protein S5 [Patescibacteria group bacterium]|nr:30S ribosomal protein S5 [Patescibacteria group bacterium]
MQKGKQQRNRRGDRNENRDEFDQVVLDLARVTRVMAGGKRMRFRACIAIGDKKGRVGVGIAKGADVQLAISKAVNDAKKNLIKVEMTETGTIPHEVRIRNYSAHLLIKPAPSGTGIIAGSVLRQIFELSGINDIVGKIMGTGNKVNNSKAVIEALSSLRKPRKTNKPIEKSIEKKDAKDEKEKKSEPVKKDNNKDKK